MLRGGKDKVDTLSRSGAQELLLLVFICVLNNKITAQLHKNTALSNSRPIVHHREGSILVSTAWPYQVSLNIFSSLIFISIFFMSHSFKRFPPWVSV